jgi:hypothetical protein
MRWERERGFFLKSLSTPAKFSCCCYAVGGLGRIKGVEYSAKCLDKVYFLEEVQRVRRKHSTMAVGINIRPVTFLLFIPTIKVAVERTCQIRSDLLRSPLILFKQANLVVRSCTS